MARQGLEGGRTICLRPTCWYHVENLTLSSPSISFFSLPPWTLHFLLTQPKFCFWLVPFSHVPPNNAGQDSSLSEPCGYSSPSHTYQGLLSLPHPGQSAVSAHLPQEESDLGCAGSLPQAEGPGDSLSLSLQPDSQGFGKLFALMTLLSLLKDGAPTLTSMLPSSTAHQFTGKKV